MLCRVRSRTGGQRMAPLALTLWTSQCAAGCRASARAAWPASRAAMRCWGASPTAQSVRARSRRPCCGHGRATGTFLLQPALQGMFDAPSARSPYVPCGSAEAFAVCDTTLVHRLHTKQSIAFQDPRYQSSHKQHVLGRRELVSVWVQDSRVPCKHESTPEQAKDKLLMLQGLCLGRR